MTTTSKPTQGTDGSPSINRAQRRDRILELVQARGVIGVLIIVCAVAGVFFPSFLTLTNLGDIATAACFLGLVTIGQSYVIVLGGLDLSVGSVVSLGTVIAALMVPHGGILAFLVPVVAGLAIGLINGLLIAKAKMAPFIVTLASMLAVGGLALVLSPTSITITDEGLFSAVASGAVLGISNLIWLLAAAFAVAALVLNRTSGGTSIFAIGGSEESARMLGVRIDRTKIAVYALSGAMAGLAGALLAARLSSGLATAGAGYELQSIAAAVVGGVLLTGGVGTMLGALAGVLLLGVIQNLINQIGTLNAYYQNLVTGLFLVLAVVVQSQLSNRRNDQ